MLRGKALPIVNSTLCLVIIAVCLSLFLTRGLGLYAARAMGKSMLPTIPDDALVIMAVKEPKVGDIVHVSNQYVNYVHRLIEIDGGVITTKGDNSQAQESALLRDVSGVVVYFAPFSYFLCVTAVVVGTELLLAVFWSVRVLRGFTWLRAPSGI